MGLLNNLFRQKKSTAYADAGMALLFKLVQSLSLPGWKECLPSYTSDEHEVIGQKLASFQSTANSVGGGEVGFHPDAAADLQRRMAASALVDLANDACLFAEDLPSDWRTHAATYLKAWSASLDPRALMGLGSLLEKAGRHAESRETFRVLLAFPSYAPSFFDMPHDRDLVDEIVNTAKESLARLG